MPLKRILFDENFSYRVAEGMKNFEDVKGEIEITTTQQAFSQSAFDVTIASGMKINNDVLLTQDLDFKKEKALTGIIINRRLGIINFRPPNGLNYWKQTELLWKNWLQIRDVVLKEKPPYLFEVKPRSFNRIALI